MRSSGTGIRAQQKKVMVLEIEIIWTIQKQNLWMETKSHNTWIQTQIFIVVKR